MTERDDRARLLSEMAQSMHDTTDAEQTMTAIFEQSVQVLPDVTDVSITIRCRGGTFASLGSSSEFAQRADELQYILGEGPCVEAASYDGDGLVRSGDVRTDRRWPQWGPRVADAGAGSMISIALLSHGEPYGSINMYSRRVGQFAEAEEIALAQLWASHAAATLSAARAEADLNTAIDSRHTIGMAQGILMERYSLDPDTAFRLLTRAASRHEQRVHVVATDIIRTRKSPDT